MKRGRDVVKVSLLGNSSLTRYARKKNLLVPVLETTSRCQLQKRLDRVIQKKSPRTFLSPSLDLAGDFGKLRGPAYPG